jgi:hypothetical protein
MTKTNLKIELSQPVITNFSQRIENMILEKARLCLTTLCADWVEVFGQKYEFALEVQLEASFTEFFNYYIKQSEEKKEEIRSRIEGKKKNINKRQKC